MMGIFVLGVFIFAFVKLGKPPEEAAGRYGNVRAIPVNDDDEWEDDD